MKANAVGTNDLTIPSPDPVDIPAGQRRSVRMHAISSQIGVWPVNVEPVNADGTPLGSSTDFKLRSSHVGQFIWGILGVGSVVLLIGIALRIRRQVKARQRMHGPLLKRGAE